MLHTQAQLKEAYSRPICLACAPHTLTRDGAGPRPTGCFWTIRFHQPCAIWPQHRTVSYNGPAWHLTFTKHSSRPQHSYILVQHISSTCAARYSQPPHTGTQHTGYVLSGSNRRQLKAPHTRHRTKAPHRHDTGATTQGSIHTAHASNMGRPGWHRWLIPDKTCNT